MKLTDEVFRSFRVSKVFRENTDRVNCIDFSANGEHMISSSNDDSIVVYCCQEGRCALNRKHNPEIKFVLLADQRELSTAKSMAVTYSNIHMLLTQLSTLQIK